MTTARLRLRPSGAADAERAFEIQSDWKVARMLRMVRFPPDLEETRRWFDDHERQRLQGEAHRFAVELEARVIGLVDIDEVKAGWGDLGYWFEPAVWGVGYAFEAARAVTRFAFEDVGLVGLRAGHAEDNPASGRVLLKLGFRQTDTVQVESRSRGENIRHVRYVLPGPFTD